MNKREKILLRIPLVRSIPDSALRVIRLIQDPDFHMPDLMRAIEYDQGLTLNVLKMANSAYYGSPRSTSSLREAVTRLGANNIYRIVVASVVAPATKQSIKGYDLPTGQLWAHSVAVAIGVEKLSQALKLKMPAYAFTAAILHDIGKIVLGTFLEIDAESIKHLLRRNRYSFDEAERKVLGIDHADVGAHLIASWNVPDEIVNVVRWHHQPDAFKGDSTVLDLVHVSDVICLMSGIGAGSDGSNYAFSNKVVDRINMNIIDTEHIVSEVMSELEEVKELFDTEALAGR